ncbi:MAG: ATP-dependent zinc metalloprotease FtsH, partial [Clostridia bacterium]|nr:ATP-dependent zinc metalloprotease FtsH [Clostridia bacterium]
ATDENNKVTFNDVAGADEEKKDLEEIVDFLKDPKRFIELGARIPKGVLLVGPPGTGKTLIAKAVAGEAKVPFFSISGSDFVELYVGVGASRVRDLFSTAKKNAPAIVFIDEIDAVGRRRGAGLGGGHDEREQTLNQLLVEMDGFGNNTGVIVIAATNRADILDPALLRPGRFDRQIYIGVPDIKGREAILNVHARKKPFEDDISFESIARSTVGFTGADLENLLNEAALLTARAGKKKIGNREIDEAFIKIIMGNEKKSRVINERERKLTAYHEAGHALAARLLPTQDPVQQISIIPRGRAGGFTLNMPKEDKYTASRKEMLDELVVLLGGRAAEQLRMDDISTGASNDIERASELARKMVTKYGMSDKLGPISFGNDHDEVFLGRDFATSKNISDGTAKVIDEEIKAMIDNAYQRALQLLNDNMEAMERVAAYLLEYETMYAAEFEKVFNGESVEKAETPAEPVDTEWSVGTQTEEVEPE